MTKSDASLKTVRDQVRELTKLVLDAQDQLDRTVRGLQMLQARLDADADSPGASDRAPGN